MIELDVYLTLEDGSHLQAGQMVMTEPGGAGVFDTAFRYTPDYLSDPRAFPLDPRALSLSIPEAGIHAGQLEPPLSVFRDALPDVWGRRIMVARHALGGNDQLEPNLLRLMGAGGLGALSFFERGIQPDFTVDDAVNTAEVADLLEAAQQFESGGRVDQSHLARLFRAGGSAGGMHPKALFHDIEGEWIGKFATVDDRDDVVGIEAASLEVARAAGLHIPRTRLLCLAGGRKALLVGRFDVTHGGGRRHVLSLSTLMQERRGIPVLHYEDVIEQIVRFSFVPQGDLLTFYRHMAFNAAIGNTDDHLKNWAFIHAAGGFCLTPAFDLLPDVGRRCEHILRFQGSNRAPGRDRLLAIAAQFGIKAAETILDEVCEGVMGFPAAARETGVPQMQIRRYELDINERVSRLSGVSPWSSPR